MRKPATLGTILPPIMAFCVAAILFAAYTAPFYGALNRDDRQGDNGITVEDFDMPADMPPERLPSGTIAGEEGSETPANPLPDASGQNDITPLERVEPRPPLSDLGLATPVPEKTTPEQPSASEQVADPAAQDGVFYRPVAVAAGRLEAGNHTIELKDVNIVEPDAICADINGDIWQCGMQARTAFRSWLRGRTVICDVKDIDQTQNLITTTCSLAGSDIGRWLVQNGWARARFDGAYSDDQTQAEKALVGVFGRKPASETAPLSGDGADSAVPELPFETQLPAETMPQTAPPVQGQSAQPDLPFPPAPQQ